MDPDLWITELFNEHYSFMIGIAYGILKNREAAEDAVQNALLKLFLTAHQYDPNRPIRAWICTFVRRAALDLRREMIKKGHDSLEDAYGNPLKDEYGNQIEQLVHIPGPADSLLWKQHLIKRRDIFKNSLELRCRRLYIHKFASSEQHSAAHNLAAYKIAIRLMRERKAFPESRGWMIPLAKLLAITDTTMRQRNVRTQFKIKLLCLADKTCCRIYEEIKRIDGELGLGDGQDLGLSL